MKVIESNKEENYIIVDVEDDQNTDYLWKWGRAVVTVNYGQFEIIPANTNRMNFQTTLEHLVKISNGGIENENNHNR